jgi:hypothetical protein
MMAIIACTCALAFVVFLPYAVPIRQHGEFADYERHCMHTKAQAAAYTGACTCSGSDNLLHGISEHACTLARRYEHVQPEAKALYFLWRAR